MRHFSLQAFPGNPAHLFQSKSDGTDSRTGHQETPSSLSLVTRCSDKNHPQGAGRAVGGPPERGDPPGTSSWLSPRCVREIAHWAAHTGPRAQARLSAAWRGPGPVHTVRENTVFNRLVNCIQHNTEPGAGRGLPGRWGDPALLPLRHGAGLPVAVTPPFRPGCEAALPVLFLPVPRDPVHPELQPGPLYFLVFILRRVSLSCPGRA